MSAASSRRRLALLPLTVAGLVPLAATGARPEGGAAAPAAPEFAARPAAEAGSASRERIVDAIQKRYNAKVVRITETQFNGRPALELRLLSEQRVWNVTVDAESGQVLAGG